MKLTTAAAVLALSLPVALSAQTSGVSNPPPDTETVTKQQSAPIDPELPPGYQPTPVASQRRAMTPSTDLPPVTAPASQSETYAPYRPATPPSDAPQGLAGTPVPNPDGMIVGDPGPRAAAFPSNILLKARVLETLSTSVNHAGDPFSAIVTEPVYQNNHLLIPAGSTLEGRLTEVHGGHRIRGAAALHLEPHRIILPDGSHYDLHAQLIDTSQSFATRIDSEGTLYRRDHIKETVAALGIATGTGAVAGAVIGGGVGAGVGALVGAGVGTAWWLKQDRQTVLPKDTNLIFTLNEPITIASIAR
ncbi:conjugation TrbI-like protein [Granulicella pectinivorans]|uniref:Conjugation TrbI-like protein n=1 Tax=Granulicella pectinivorans TaxID=474950 RepID=A0A1I6MMZ3_9BACT|nr:hypothetical protein [Granulicella pectinivorans]SFS17059.1 conjugation TrbI-like protein [Granulicella pectinivorans]